MRTLPAVPRLVRQATLLAGLFVVAAFLPSGFGAGASLSGAASLPLAHPAALAAAAHTPALGPAAPAISHRSIGPAAAPAVSPAVASGRGTFWDNHLIPTPGATNLSCAYFTQCMNDTGNPSIVSTSAGVIAVAYTAFTNATACPSVSNLTDTEIGFTVSTNGGTSWSAPTYLNNRNCTSPFNETSAINPALTVLANGTFVLAYIAYNVSSTASCSGYSWYPGLNPCFLLHDDLVVTRSFNNGTTWTVPYVVHASSNPSLLTVAPVPAQPAIASVGKTVYLAWTNFSFPQFDQFSMAPSIGLHVTVSTDGGATWGTSHLLPAAPGSWGSATAHVAYAPSLVVNSTGTLFVGYSTAFRQYTSTYCDAFGCAPLALGVTADVIVARSSNNASTFQTATVASNVSVDFNGPNWANGGPGVLVSPEPALAVDPTTDRLYVAYAAGEVGMVCPVPNPCYPSDSFTNVWVSNSTNGGSTWSTPLPLGNVILGLAGAATQPDYLFLPSIGVGANGTVYVDVGQQNVSACLAGFCGLQSNIIFVSTDHGASFPSSYVPYGGLTVNNYPLWDGITSSMTVYKGVPFMAWTLEVCPGNGAVTACGSLTSFAWSQVVVTSPFLGVGVTVTFTQSGLPSSSTWSASLSGNARTGPASGPLVVSGVPTGQLEAWSAGWVNTTAWGLAYASNITLASPGTVAANTTIPVAFTEEAVVTITTVPAGYSGQPFNCPVGAVFGYNCANLAVAPWIGSNWTVVGAPLTYSIGPGSVVLSNCGACLNLSFLRWTGTGPGSWSTSVANGSTVVRGPINETANFQLLSVCNYGTCTNITYPYTFTETGLPSGTKWTVTLANQTTSSTTQGITFSTSSGPANFTVWVVPHNATSAYYGTPSRPSPVSAFQSRVRVTFALQPIDREASSLTVRALGLPNGTTAFGVSFGAIEYGVAQNTTFTLSNGAVVLNASQVYGTGDVGAYPTNFTVIPETVGVAPFAIALGGTLNLSGPVILTAVYAPEYWLSVTTTAGGTVSPAAGSWARVGLPVNLTAVPASGNAWVGWSGTGAGSYTGPLAAVTIHPRAPVTELATFVGVTPSYSLTVSDTGIPLGTPITVSVGAANFTEAAPFVIPNLAPGTYGVSIPTVYPNDTVGGRFVLQSLSSNLSLSAGSLQIDRSGTLLVGFVAQVSVSVEPAVNGTTSPAAGPYWFAAGSPVALTETALPGFASAGWTGTGNGSVTGPLSSITVVPTGPVTETPLFALLVLPPPRTFSLTVSETGLPSGVTWGAATGPHGASGTGTLVLSGLNGTYTVGVPMVLGATDVRYAPSGEGSFTERVTSNISLSVVFTTQYLVSVTASAGGTATPSSQWWNASATVSLAAVANASSTFLNWSGTGPGAYSGTSASPMVTVTGPVREVATFAPKAPVSSSGTSGVTSYALPVGLLLGLLVVGLLVGLVVGRSRQPRPAASDTSEPDGESVTETPTGSERSESSDDSGPPSSGG